MALEKLFGSAKDGAMGKLDKILDYPDTFEKEWQRKSMYIIFDVGILFIVFGITSMMMGSGMNPLHWFSGANFHAIMLSLSNPNFQTLMSLPMIAGGAGFGLSFLLEDLIPQKYHSMVRKAFAVVAPILIAGAGVALIMSAAATSSGPVFSTHYSFVKSMGSSYFAVGVLLIPLSAYAFSRIPEVFKKQTPVLKGEVEPLPKKWSNHLKRYQLTQMRGYQDREEMESERRRKHDEGSWFSRIFRGTPRPIPLQEIASS